eukprot:1139015-Pelagomonas_calceolata.AAC.1
MPFGLVWPGSSTPLTLWSPLMSLAFSNDTHKAAKLALNLRAHSVQCTYDLASTIRALEKTSFNSHFQDQQRKVTIIFTET